MWACSFHRGHVTPNGRSERIQFVREEDGATAIEYGPLAALISVAIVTVLGLVGTSLDPTFGTVAEKLLSAPA